ncbi:MAG: hypothetical protein P1V51_16995 [Deltaproteobacteria bacterium]|nr:hypothetical protein [Deltaproteobacteria bacterium]
MHTRWLQGPLAAALLAAGGCGAFATVGVDPPADGGRDAGGDGGPDGGVDAGPDAGAPDSGEDGGGDAGNGDGGLLPLGSRCSRGEECATGSCDSTGWGYPPPTCTAYCDAADTACPEGGVCAVPGAFSGACVRACQGDDDCPEGFTCEFLGSGPEIFGCLASGHFCDPKAVVCDALPPSCGGGEFPVVDRGCWGPCVPWDACLPIACDPELPHEGQCPPAYVCYRSTRTCGPPL